MKARKTAIDTNTVDIGVADLASATRWFPADVHTEQAEANYRKFPIRYRGPPGVPLQVDKDQFRYRVRLRRTISRFAIETQRSTDAVANAESDRPESR